MSASHVATWRPTRHLNHLRSLRGRNLVVPEGCLSSTSYDFELSGSQTTKEEGTTEHHQQKLYVSEQVQGTCNPDWAPVFWPDSVSQLRTLTSLTVNVYANADCNHQAKRPTPGHIIVRGSQALPYGANDSAEAASEEVEQYCDQQHAVSAISLQHNSHHPDVTTKSPEKSKTDTSRAAASHVVPVAEQSTAADSSDDQQDDEQSDGLPSQQHMSCSPSGRTLTLTAEVNLDELHVFHQELASLNVSLPPNTLIVELAEGLCLFPSLNLTSTSSDLAPPSDTATASTPVLPGSLAAPPTAADTVGASSLLSEQSARQQLAESLLHRPLSRSSTPTPITPDIAPEVGRLRGLVKAKLGFAFGSGPELGGVSSPLGASPEQQARLASSHQASASGKAGKAYKVDVATLDAEMVALAQKQAELQATLERQRDLCHQLAQAIHERNTARQQRLRLEALRHGREEHQQHAAFCQESITGANRSKDLTQTILRAQLQSLQHALQALKAARRRLDSADVMLKGPQGVMKYRPLHAQLVGRRCRMATMLGNVYSVGPQTVTVCQAPPMGFLEDQLERGWWAGSDTGSSCTGSPKALIVTRHKQSPTTAKNGFRQAALLTIGGLDLDPLLGKGGLDGIMNWEGDRQEMRGAAAALGYLAAAVEHLAFYLDVPLRYPIKPGNCKTLILSHAAAAGSYRSPDSEGHSRSLPVVRAQTAFSRQSTAGVTDFPLYCEGVDRGRFAYAIYLLNKDVEQILNAHGLTATGASQVLANLHKLLAAAASA